MAAFTVGFVSALVITVLLLPDATWECWSPLETQTVSGHSFHRYGRVCQRGERGRADHHLADRSHYLERAEMTRRQVERVAWDDEREWRRMLRCKQRTKWSSTMRSTSHPCR